MLPDFSCHRCTKPMDRIDEYSWVCIPCRINEYWFTERTEDDVRAMLQREWEAGDVA